MNSFTIANKEYQRSNFHLAINLYLKNLTLCKLDVKENHDVCQKILDCYKRLGVDPEPSSLEIIASSYSSNNNLYKANYYYEKVLNKKREGKLFRILISNYNYLGEIEKSEVLAKSFTKYCIHRKKIKDCLDFLESNHFSVKYKSFFLKRRVDCYLLSGNYQGLMKLLTCSRENKILINKKILSYVIEELSSKKSYWVQNLDFLKEILKILSSEIKELNLSEKEYRKFIIKTLLDSFKFKDIEDYVINLSLFYAKKYNKKNIGRDSSYLKDDLDLLSYFSKIKEDKIITIEMLKSKEETLKMIKKQVRELSSPEYLMESDVNEESILELIEEIKVFCKKNKKREELVKTKNAKNLILELGKKYVNANIGDLVYTFNEMNLYDVSLDIISYVNAEENKLILKIRNIYLKTITLMKSGDFYKSLDSISFAFENFPLSEEDKTMFYYLKAEIFFEIGFPKRANAILDYLDKYNLKNPFVESRLSKFEKN